MALRTADDRTRAALGTAGVLLLASAAVLAGCVQQRETGPKAQVGSPEQASLGFFFNDDSERPDLTFGIANSDNIIFGMQCTKGARSLDIYDEDSGSAKTGQPLNLSSGGVRVSLPAQLSADQETGESFATVKTTSDIALVRSFRKTGEITFEIAGRKHSITASASDRAQIRRFFDACER
jgi:hypothetical protein